MWATSTSDIRDGYDLSETMCGATDKTEGEEAIAKWGNFFFHFSNCSFFEKHKGIAAVNDDLHSVSFALICTQYHV